MSQTASATAAVPTGSIRRGAPTPFYAQLAQILRAAVQDGIYRPGDPLPAENDLCISYGLSRTVVRQALNELVAEGLIIKERGRGSFVATPKMADLVVADLRGFSDEMGARGYDVGSIILSQEIIAAPAQVADDLRLRAGAKVVHIARIRTANGDPIVKVDTYLPLPRFRRLASMRLEERSLYDTLAGVFGVKIGGGWRRIEATVASRELADLLGTDIGGPMLELTALTTDVEGVPFELFRAWYRGDRTSFEVRV